jgi:hypothetical protein
VTAAETLIDQLPPPEGGWTANILAAKDGPGFGFILKNLPKFTGVLTRDDAVKAIGGRVHELLRLDLGVILVGGWKKLSELQGYRNTNKYAPEETILVEITRHTLSSTHKPTLDIIVNQVKVDEVPFELKLAFIIDGAVLTIRDGKILSVSPGACKGSVELKCEGYSIAKRESAAMRVPAAWTFDPPIEIAALPR